MLNPGDVGWSSQTWNGLTRVAFGWSSSVKRRDVTHDWADCALTDSETPSVGLGSEAGMHYLQG